jgi:hypothetical protein
MHFSSALIAPELLLPVLLWFPRLLQMRVAGW